MIVLGPRFHRSAHHYETRFVIRDVHPLEKRPLWLDSRTFLLHESVADAIGVCSFDT